MNTPTPEREQLVADIKHAGFYPDLVLEVVDDALAGMNPDAHFVQHETHFSRDDFHRHITVMVLCGDFIVFAHLDDQHLEGDAQGTVAHVSVEAVHLSDLNAVTMSYGFSQPQAYNAGNTAARTSRCVFPRPLTAPSRFSVRSTLRVPCIAPACAPPAAKHTPLNSSP